MAREVNTASLHDRPLKGLFTTMMITQKYHLILGAFLLLAISCDCNQRPVGNGQDDWEAILETASVTILGTVNDNPVIEVDGEIQENNSKETILGALFIPDGDSIGDAAAELAKNKDPKDLDTGIALAHDRHAYYDKTIAVGYTGRASVTAFSEKYALQASKNYNAHLILGEQHVSYSTAGVSFRVPAKTGFQLQLDSADAKRQIAGTDEHISLDLKSTVTFTGAPPQAGFIFIEQGSTEASAAKLIAALIKQRSPLPTGPDFHFQKFYSYKDIIIYPCGSLVGTGLDIADAPDTAGILKRGATYQVYCYVVDGNNNYTISQEDKSITIPRPIVGLKMEEASIQELIYAPNIGINDLKLRLRGSITKHEGTVAPQVGFLLTTGKPDRDTAARTVKSLITDGALPYFNSDSSASHADIIHVADIVSADTTGEQSFSAQGDNYPPEILGRDYNVYFWLRDGSGEIFVSDNSTQLRTPKVDLSITDVTSKKGLSSALDLTLKTRVDNEINLSNPNVCFLFLEQGSGQVITEDILRAILNSKGPYVDRPPDHILRVSKDPFSPGNSSYSGSDSTYSQFAENSQYDVYYCLRTDSAIFCATDPSKTLVTGQKNKPSKPSVVIELSGVTYYVYDNGRDKKVERENNNDTKRLLTKNSDSNELKAVLGEVFHKNGNPDDEQIQAFLDGMLN
ncbi:MAG: hypothetical protein AAF392_02055 [Bacteroidota bacterium]